MSHFHEAQTEADLPPSHQGEPYTDEPTESDDTALTDYLGARQPVLEPVDALLSARKES